MLHEPGRIVSLADLKGAPFVLNVWGSWCPTCREEHPVLTRFAETKRVRVIGLDWKDDPRRRACLAGAVRQSLLARRGGRGRQVPLDCGVSGAPETFLVDAEGIVRWKNVGALTDDIIRDELLPAIAHPEAPDEPGSGAGARLRDGDRLVPDQRPEAAALP